MSKKGGTMSLHPPPRSPPRSPSRGRAFRHVQGGGGRSPTADASTSLPVLPPLVWPSPRGARRGDGGGSGSGGNGGGGGGRHVEEGIDVNRHSLFLSEAF